MLNLYYTEKLLGFQGVELKNILENEESFEISIEQPRKECICPCCGELTNKIHFQRLAIRDSNTYALRIRNVIFILN